MATKTNLYREVTDSLPAAARFRSKVKLDKVAGKSSTRCVMGSELVQQMLSGLPWLLLIADLGLIGGAFLVEIARDL